MACMTCGNAGSTETSEIEETIISGMTPTFPAFCVKCFTFWAIVLLLTWGLLAHYHEADGSVRF